MSLLVQERGLKQCFGIDLKTFVLVAPRAGAWIETYNHDYASLD